MFATLIAAAALAAAPPLRLGALLHEADEKNAELQSATLKASAAESAVAPAGALDDPMLMLQLWNQPLDFSSVPVMATLTQNLPLGNKRGLRRELAAADSRGARAQAEMQRRELRAQVEKAYFDLYVAERTDAIDAEIAQTLAELQRAALNRLATGLGAQADVLKVQAACVQLDSDREVAQQQARSARVRLGALLDRPTEPPEGSPTEPSLLSALPAEAELRERALAERPELAEAAAMVDSADAEEKLMRAERVPDLGLSLGAMHMFGGMGEQNFAFAGLQVNLPVFGRSKNGPRIEAASTRASAWRSAARALRDKVEAEVADARAQAESERHVVELHHRLVPLTREALESGLHAYAIGKGDFTGVMDTVRELQMHEIELAQHLAAYEQRLAELERAVGGEIGLVSSAESGGHDEHH